MNPDGGDPGGPPVVLINSYDLKYGNGLARGITGSSIAGTKGDFLFQANLNTADYNGVTQFSSCTGGADCFTFVAGISEVVTSNSGGTLQFGFDSTGPTNFFRIYANDTQQGNNLTGDCFADGTGLLNPCLPKDLVLEGTFQNDGSFSSAFTVTLDPVTHMPIIQDLDQFGANDYPGVKSVLGNGSFQGNIDTWTVVNPLYFPAGIPSTLFFHATSQQSLPYLNVDPSACFSADGLIGGSVTGVFAGTSTLCNNQAGVFTVGGPSLTGGTNGTSGPNTMLQTHAGMAFVGPEAVPEPATLTLLGIGLVGAASRRRRQLRNKE